MDIKQAYNTWASQYDTNDNKTRDLEAIALRSTLANIEFVNCLEIGCGTGKNTEWLITKANHITAVDFSDEMLEKAKKKIVPGKVQFIQADISGNWEFADMKYDLITFSLVLEHIENLDDIFQKASKVISSNRFIYIGELHPFKQYTGTKARFDTKDGTQTLTCFNHHVSEFVQSAKKFGFDIIDLYEYFDDEDRTQIPRILTMLLKKS